MTRKRNYMNPYYAGILLGLVLLAAMFFSGRGLGASGGIKYTVVAAVGAIDKQHALESPYYSKYFENGESPLKNWLALEVLGMLLGGFISGAISGRLKFTVEKSPKISRGKRLLFAFLGGVFFVYGAQLARGCIAVRRSPEWPLCQPPALLPCFPSSARPTCLPGFSADCGFDGSKFIVKRKYNSAY